MARTKEFDRASVLGAAIAVFREHGYEGTSTGELLRVMGIGRQSLYDTFGDKRTLYLEALARYNADSVGAALDKLRCATSPLKGVESVLWTFVEQAEAGEVLGCLGVNSLCEFGQTDAGVNALQLASSKRLLDGLQQALAAARDQGELPAGLDVAGAARFLATTMSGLKLAMRGGADAAALRSIVEFALKSLRVA